MPPIYGSAARSGPPDERFEVSSGGEAGFLYISPSVSPVSPFLSVTCFPLCSPLLFLCRSSRLVLSMTGIDRVWAHKERTGLFACPFPSLMPVPSALILPFQDGGECTGGFLLTEKTRYWALFPKGRFPFGKYGANRSRTARLKQALQWETPTKPTTGHRLSTAQTRQAAAPPIGG